MARTPVLDIAYEDTGNAQGPNEGATFARLVARRVIDGAGHFMPRERPAAVSSALLELLTASR